MARVILVHGAWSTAATWDALVPLLVAAGHDVTAVTLPGHGDDPTPPAEVGLSSYARFVADLLRAGEPAVLVGHSMGGMVISAAAELVPEQVRRLVYIAAFLPRDGQSLLDLIRMQAEPGIRAAVRPGPEGATTLEPEAAAAVLFQDATPAQRAAGIAGLTRQPNRGQTEAVRLSADRFGRVPRSYILCREDRTVSPGLQRAMLEATPVGDVHELASGHLPQLTCAPALAERLDRIMEREA